MSLLAVPALLALLALPQPALGYSCYYDAFGGYNCNNALTNGARIGIGIGIAAVVIILLSCFTYTRRRRLAAANALYLRNQQQALANPGGPMPMPNQGYNPNYATPYAGAYQPGPPAQQGFAWRGMSNGAEQGFAGPPVRTTSPGGSAYPPPPNYENATAVGGPEATTYPPKSYQGPGQYEPPQGSPPPANYDPTNAQNYPPRR